MTETEHHHTLAPSMFPALSECACYIPDKKESPEQSRGTKQHKALKQILEGTPLTVELSQSELSDVNSAVEQIRQIFNEHEIFDNSFDCEKRVELRGDNFDIITFGTVDILSADGSVLIDFKSSDFNAADYDQQINCYAYIVMETYNLGGIHSYIVFPNRKYYRYINYDYAKAQFQRVCNNVNDPNKVPIPCNYCHQCRNQKDCEAFLSFPIQIGKLRDDYPFELGLDGLHISKVTSPELMSKLLKFKDWLNKNFVESVEYWAKEMAKTNKIPDYVLQERKGRAEITNIDEAKKLLGLTEEEFLQICNISLKDLSDLYAKKKDISGAKAKKEVEEILSPVLLYNPPSYALVKERKPTIKKKGELQQSANEGIESGNSFEDIINSK